LLDNPVSSIESNNIVDIEIYPNPASNSLYVQGENVVQCKLYNNSGVEVLTSNQKSIDVSYLKPGIYFVEVTKKNRTSVQKVIISR
ncbi:MAG: T9SS type A sorting domain-containing protein, partial [Bacteroidia bacterium]|nr:T9SS type A sorting domain-containing protein [Bacteroidia bacterium]